MPAAGLTIAGLIAYSPTVLPILKSVVIKLGILTCSSGICYLLLHDKEKAALLRALKVINIEDCKIVETIKIRGGKRFTLVLPKGIGLKDLTNKQDELELMLNARTKIYRNNFNIVIECIFGTVPNYIELTGDILDEVIEQVKQHELGILIGKDAAGIRIEEMKQLKHILEGGATGTGKTVWLRSVLLTLVSAYTPEHVHLHIGDLKEGVGLQLFAKLPHVQHFETDLYGVADMLEYLEDELQRRYSTFRNVECEDIYEYNKQFPQQRLPYKLFVVDEIAQMNPKDALSRSPERQFRHLLHSRIGALARMGRGAGIHCILGTQRPDADVVSGTIKSNMLTRIAFRCSDKVASDILLDSGEASLIPPIEGRMLFKGDMSEVQGYIIHKEELRQRIEGIIEQYKYKEA